MNRPYAKLTITKKGERAARSGHPWVYGEEVTHVEGTYQTGDIVDVYSDKDRYLGTGFANDISKIRVRIVSRNANDRFDEAFWQRRVKYALDYRKTVMGDKDFACCRLIFGDADDMPGLTVDRYNDVLVAPDPVLWHGPSQTGHLQGSRRRTGRHGRHHPRHL